MPTLNDLVHEHSALDEVDVEWLHQLVGDWQLLSDLSFADLVLWVPARAGGWYAAAHIRPTTGPMVFFDDVVGQRLARGRRPVLDQA
ncbi:MAG: histidine kinase N-terminal domain-containing protein, partial [Actinomycetota bacterium]